MMKLLFEVTRLRLRRAAGVTSKKNLVYRSGSTNPKHRLDVYFPRAPRAPQKEAIVHFLHGGYWVGGDKDYRHAITGLYGSVGEALAAQGIITVVQSYRLGQIADVLDDVRAALRFTNEQAAAWGGDPARVFVMGHSAGGHLAALLATDDSSGLRGAIALSAIWDIEDMAESQDGAFQQRVTYPVFGRDQARWAAYSPYAKLSHTTKPLLIAIGSRDYPYLVPQAERARDRLAELGRPPEYVVVEGNDHDAMVLRIGARNDNLTSPIVSFVQTT